MHSSDELTARQDSTACSRRGEWDSSRRALLSISTLARSRRRTIVSRASSPSSTHSKEVGCSARRAFLLPIIRSHRIADTQQVLILDPDRDNVTGKIEKYTRKMIATFVEQEPSKYVQPIFQSILQLSDANKVGRRSAFCPHDAPGSNIHRSSFWGNSCVWPLVGPPPPTCP